MSQKKITKIDGSSLTISFDDNTVKVFDNLRDYKTFLQDYGKKDATKKPKRQKTRSKK